MAEAIIKNNLEKGTQKGFVLTLNIAPIFILSSHYTKYSTKH